MSCPTAAPSRCSAWCRSFWYPSATGSSGAFSFLGLACVFAKPFKNKLVGVAVGSAAVCVLRFLCSFLSGVLIWGNLSDGLPAWIYSLTYNGSYMLPEGIMTTIAVVLLYKAAPQLFSANN